MKSLLIVTEQFTLGGLETHIRGEIEHLIKAGVAVHLAVGQAFQDVLLPPGLTSMTYGLPLGPECSPKALLVAIDRLRQIIREHAIECVHVHPFTSIIPAVVAAELERVPYSITLHGPASMASYGPIYDLLLKQIVLPSAPLIVAVSPEVQNLLITHAPTESVLCIPNAVSFEESFGDTLTANTVDKRWLVVSRLDEFKIQGIADFCIKAKVCGIPGVLVVGDGPAKQQLFNMLEARGAADYVELIGASAEVPSLLPKFSGVAGMGRVVLEGISARKPVVLVGYDGVKGVVDKQLLASTAKRNFSGRDLPTIDSDEFFAQLRGKTGQGEISEVFEFAKTHFNAREAWTRFLSKMSSLSAPVTTALSGFYHTISGSLVDGAEPYLYSKDTVDRIETVVCSKNYYDTRLSAAVSFCARRLESGNHNLALIERDGRIVDLNKALAECEGQIADLNKVVVERDGKIASLNLAIAECDGDLHAARHYIQDKEIYIAMLKSELEEFHSRIGQKFLRYVARIQRVPYYMNRIAAVVKSRGLAGLWDAIGLKLSRRVLGNTNSYIQPQLSTGQVPCDAEQNPCNTLVQPLLCDSLVIITGVPFDDVGGGQRAAQIARCALKSGRKVVYIYIYKKFDFELNQYVDSVVAAHGLVHMHIGATSPLDVLRMISPDAVLLIELPHKEAMPYLELFKSRGMRTVFELIDDWESSLGGDWFNVDVYRRFVREANVAIGTARVLVQKLRDLGCGHAIYLPNAANEYIFDKYKNHLRPSDMPSGIKRIALYFGSLYGEWFAWDYMQEAAVQNPDIGFVLIGDRPSADNLPNLPKNVHLLGSKRIEELPAYLAHSDLCLLPFSPGKISDAVSPIKVFEYLFSGKPVVATQLPEVVDYPGISVAGSPDEFSKLCREVVFTEEQERKNDHFIFNNSWFSRLDMIVSGADKSRFEGVVSAVILIHNNKSIIGRCLESLLLHCDFYLKEVIVVDNASADGGADFVKMNFPSVCVIENTANGCSSGRNLGVQRATGQFLAFFDSDQWFTSSSGFQEALTILNRDASVGAIGWAAGWFETGRDDLGGMIADYCPNRAMNHMAIQQGYRSDIGYLGTGGFFMPKVVFDATEGFDVAYDPTCFEDTDMSFQIKKLGFDVCYRDLTGIRHQPHQTTKASSQSDAYAKLFKRNAEYFKKKWSGYPEFFIDYIP